MLTRVQRAGEAEQPLRDALEIRRSAFGAESLQAALVEQAFGVCLLAMAQYPQAEQPLAHALRVIETHRGRDHPQTDLARQHLGNLYVAWGKPERAAALDATATTPATAPATQP